MKNYKFWLIIVFLCLLIDNSQAITDSNLSNNGINVNVDVIDTKNLYLRFVPIDKPDSEDYNDEITSIVTFIKATFPISDTGSRVYFQTDYTTTPDERNDVYSLMFEIDKSSLLSGHINRVVGVVPPNWFLNTNQKAGTKGVGLVRDSIDSSLIEITGLRHVAPHEIGHTFDLCDENSNASWNYHEGIFSFECPNGDIDNDNILDDSCPSKGCPISTLGVVVPWVESTDTVNLKNFMGYNYDENDVWLSNESYSHLLKKFDKSIFPEITLFRAGIVSGFIDKNGNGNLESIYIVENRTMTDTSGLGNGSYSVILKDNEGNVTQNFTFEPSFLESSFNGSVTETNTSYFLFVMNLTDDVTKIILKMNSTIIEEVNKTPNTPTINITYPNGGEILENTFNITWNATDADGDDIYYAILISDDNGSNYTTLDIDLNQTYYELDPNDHDGSSNYVIKVLATDGVNTGNNITSTFTLGNPLNITTLQSIYSDGNLRIFEFVIKNTLTTTLNNISWTFKPGDNTTINSTQEFILNANEEIFVYLEYNYSSSGTYTVTANATSPAIAKVKTTSVNVGDLLITSFGDINISGTTVIFETIVKNDLETVNITNINWTLNMGDGNTISSDTPFNLTAEENILIYVGYNYTQTGDYTLTVNVTNGISTDSETISIDLKDIELTNLTVLDTNNTKRIFEFVIENTLSVNLSKVNWTLDTGLTTIVANQLTNLTTNEKLYVYVGYNYTQTGTYNVNATAINGSLKDSANYAVVIN